MITVGKIVKEEIDPNTLPDNMQHIQFKTHEGQWYIGLYFYGRFLVKRNLEFVAEQVQKWNPVILK